MPSPRTLPLTMTKPSLYTSEDVFREPSEGRSLHDDANLFYRKVMGLETPIKAVTQPTINEIHDAIGTKLSGNDFCMWVFHRDDYRKIRRFINENKVTLES